MAADLFTDIEPAPQPEARPGVQQPAFVLRRNCMEALLYRDLTGAGTSRVQVSLYDLDEGDDEPRYCGSWVCENLAAAKSKADELLARAALLGGDDDDD